MNGSIPILKPLISGAAGSYVTDYTQIKDVGMSRVAYGELKGLMRDSKLIPGHRYRITDYNTKVTRDLSDTAITHEDYDNETENLLFDIIVTALSENTLHSAAKAAGRMGSSMYGMDLGKWELRYSIDNDIEKHSWAHPEGTGVIYYMKDEYGNEAPYDFKNILFRYGKTYAPTFCLLDDNGSPISDASITGLIRNTRIAEYAVGDRMSLNNIKVFVFQSDDVPDSGCGITFGGGCHDIEISCREGSGCGITFGGGCHDIIANLDGFTHFGSGCHDIIMGLGGNNIFRDCCYDITMVGNCSYNVFGEQSQNCQLEDGCYGNVFENSCANISLGKGCANNTFGKRTRGLNLGYGCQGNVFESFCYDISLEEECINNRFEKAACEIMLSGRCTGNHFGIGTNYIHLGTGCTDNRFETSCVNIMLLTPDNELMASCCNNRFEHGCCNITVKSSDILANLNIDNSVNGRSVEIEPSLMESGGRVNVTMDSTTGTPLVYTDKSTMDLVKDVARTLEVKKTYLHTTQNSIKLTATQHVILTLVEDTVIQPVSPNDGYSYDFELDILTGDETYSVTFSDNVKWVKDLIIEPNKRYLIIIDDSMTAMWAAVERSEE